MDNKKAEFKTGDKVITLDTNEKGVISRLCPDKGIIYVRWDESKMQMMVEVSNLKKLEGK